MKGYETIAIRFHNIVVPLSNNCSIQKFSDGHFAAGLKLVWKADFCMDSFDIVLAVCCASIWVTFTCYAVFAVGGLTQG